MKKKLTPERSAWIKRQIAAAWADVAYRYGWLIDWSRDTPQTAHALTRLEDAMTRYAQGKALLIEVRWRWREFVDAHRVKREENDELF